MICDIFTFLHLNVEFCLNIADRLEIRLVHGNVPGVDEGRVEVRQTDPPDSNWGTICDDHWDNNDAHVVCFMLGYVWGTVSNKKGLRSWAPADEGKS